MGEKRKKSIRIVEIALLAAVAFQADRLLSDSDTTQDKVEAVTSTIKPSIFLDSDILHVCRQPDGTIDSGCATDQTIKAIKDNDTVMAGVWPHHVTDPVSQLEIDSLELQEAQRASRAKDIGECLLWSSRVLAPELVMQLPICD